MSRTAHIVMLLDNPFVSDLRVKKEADSLVAAGFKVTIACTQDEGLSDSEIKDGIQIRRILNPIIFHPFRRGFNAYIDELAREILDLKPSILHCHDFYTLEIGAKAKAIDPSVYLCYDSHEYFRKWLVYQDIPGWLNRLKGYLVWRSLVKKEAKNIRSCNSVIAAGEDVGNALKKDHALNINPINVRNISDIKPDPAYKETIRSILNLSDKELILVQSGNMYQTDKEIHQMIDEALGVDNLHFVFIGNRPRHYEIKSQVKKRGLAERVHFIDFNEDHLYNLLESADIGVLFMKTEKWLAHYYASSNRIMEYSLVGIPFVSVPQANSKRLDNSFKTVEFFELKSKGAFRAAIEKTAMDLTLKKERARRIAPTLSWNGEFRVVVNLYKSILEDSPKA